MGPSGEKYNFHL